MFVAAPTILTPPRWLVLPPHRGVSRRRRRLDGRWWRRLLGVAMAGEVWVDSDGKFLIDDNGKMFVCDECPCDGCPAFINVTIRSNTSCKSCMVSDMVGGLVDNSYFLASDTTWAVQGTYSVPFSSETINQCRYQAIFTSTSPYYLDTVNRGTVSCASAPHGANGGRLTLERLRFVVRVNKNTGYVDVSSVDLDTMTWDSQSQNAGAGLGWGLHAAIGTSLTVPNNIPGQYNCTTLESSTQSSLSIDDRTIDLAYP